MTKLRQLWQWICSYVCFFSHKKRAKNLVARIGYRQLAEADDLAWLLNVGMRHVISGKCVDATLWALAQEKNSPYFLQFLRAVERHGYKVATQLKDKCFEQMKSSPYIEVVELAYEFYAQHVPSTIFTHFINSTEGSARNHPALIEALQGQSPWTKEVVADYLAKLGDYDILKEVFWEHFPSKIAVVCLDKLWPTDGIKERHLSEEALNGLAHLCELSHDWIKAAALIHAVRDYCKESGGGVSPYMTKVLAQLCPQLINAGATFVLPGIALNGIEEQAFPNQQPA